MAGKKRKALSGFTALLIVLLGMAVWLFFNTKTVVVRGESMVPTFRSGQRLLVTEAYWLVGRPKPNDIVVVREFTSKGGYFIKRVVAVGGQKVEQRALWPRPYPVASPEYVVPPGQVFVLGDNRPVSEDSRRFGAIDEGLILGKVIKL